MKTLYLAFQPLDVTDHWQFKAVLFARLRLLAVLYVAFLAPLVLALVVVSS